MNGRVTRDAIARFGVGDVLVILVFVLIGEFSHGAMPWLVPQMVLETALTFLVGWVVVAPFARAYGQRALESPGESVQWSVLSWVGAAAVANAIRATSFVHGDAALSFFLVAAGFGGAMLGAWRWLRVRSLTT